MAKSGHGRTDNPIEEALTASEVTLTHLVNIVTRLTNPDHQTGMKAADALGNLAEEAPETASQVIPDISSVIGQVEHGYIRRKLSETLLELVATHPENATDARNGLTEASRIRDERYWAQSPQDEQRTIANGLEGWTHLADAGHVIPPVVVTSAADVLERASRRTLQQAIRTLGKAVETGSARDGIAVDALRELADFQTVDVRGAATKALARGVLVARPDVDPDTLQALFEENVETIDEDGDVKDAIAELEDW